jgi:hypothetical protein
MSSSEDNASLEFTAYKHYIPFCTLISSSLHLMPVWKSYIEWGGGDLEELSQTPSNLLAQAVKI